MTCKYLIFLMLISLHWNIVFCGDKSLHKNEILQYNSFKKNDIKVFGSGNIDRQILIKQFNDYMTAFFSGDVEITLKYVYDEMFKYFVDVDKRHESIDEAKKVFIREILKVERSIKEDGINYDYDVVKYEKRYSSGKNVIYVIPYILTVSRAQSKDQVNAIVLGISNDYGENWNFLQVNKYGTAEKILLQNFSRSVVDRILNL